VESHLPATNILSSGKNQASCYTRWLEGEDAGLLELEWQLIIYRVRRSALKHMMLQVKDSTNAFAKMEDHTLSWGKWWVNLISWCHLSTSKISSPC